MAENRAEIFAGTCVVAMAVGFMLYASAGRINAGEGRYPLTASFRSADGITVGSDVRLAGVTVGTVSAMSLNPQTFFADVELRLDGAVQLPTDTAIAVASEGLLGGNFIELVPGGAVEVLAPGAQIEDTQSAVSLISLLLRFVSGGDEQ